MAKPGGGRVRTPRVGWAQRELDRTEQEIQGTVVDLLPHAFKKSIETNIASMRTDLRDILTRMARVMPKSELSDEVTSIMEEL